jgi:hypothetical protein
MVLTALSAGLTLRDLPDPELVGVEEKTKFSRKMSVYPNPAKNKLTISFLSDKVTGIANVQIIDVSGRTLINKEIKVQTGINQFEIATSELLSGLYYINVTTSSGKFTAKFAKL